MPVWCVGEVDRAESSGRVFTARNGVLSCTGADRIPLLPPQGARKFACGGAFFRCGKGKLRSGETRCGTCRRRAFPPLCPVRRLSPRSRRHERPQGEGNSRRSPWNAEGGRSVPRFPADAPPVLPRVLPDGAVSCTLKGKGSGISGQGRAREASVLFCAFPGPAAGRRRFRPPSAGPVRTGKAAFP